MCVRVYVLIYGASMKPSKFIIYNIYNIYIYIYIYIYIHIYICIILLNDYHSCFCLKYYLIFDEKKNVKSTKFE
jgi:hypothetical protein